MRIYIPKSMLTSNIYRNEKPTDHIILQIKGILSYTSKSGLKNLDIKLRGTFK